MALTLVSLSFDANDPDRLAAFWAGALGWGLADRIDDEIHVRPTTARASASGSSRTRRRRR